MIPHFGMMGAYSWRTCTFCFLHSCITKSSCLCSQLRHFQRRAMHYFVLCMVTFHTPLWISMFWLSLLTELLTLSRHVLVLRFYAVAPVMMSLYLEVAKATYVKVEDRALVPTSSTLRLSINISTIIARMTRDGSSIHRSPSSAW